MESTQVSRQLKKHRVYPLYYFPLTRTERLMVKLGYGGVGRCQVCGRFTPWRVTVDNLRETGLCRWCKSVNRQRQIAYVVCRALSLARNRRFGSLAEIAQLDDLVVYNTECAAAIHDVLSRAKHYYCSEYFGPEHRSGDYVNGWLHQDLMSMSFGDSSIELIISGDVFEHIPDPYQAHREVYRVLKRGGRHVFTVPFDQAQYLDDVRAKVDETGKTVMLAEPIYHWDPVRPKDGALVYTLFSLEMLVKLRQIGFRVHFYRIFQPLYGIFGHNGTVFETIKE